MFWTFFLRTGVYVMLAYIDFRGLILVVFGLIDNIIMKYALLRSLV